MTYGSIQELPQDLREVLPIEAQETYLATYNNAWHRYADPQSRLGGMSRETVAHQIARMAIRQRFEMDDAGRWHRKPADERMQSHILRELGQTVAA